MKRLIAYGEFLIDFINESKDSFTMNPGGAPANIACCFDALGGDSMLISSLGDDLFGHFLYDKAKETKIDLSNLSFDKKRNTPLAFLRINEDFTPSYSFIHNDTSDTAIDYNKVKVDFTENDILYFGSIALTTEISRNTLIKLINDAKTKKATICFDINVRCGLANDLVEYKRLINEFIDYASIIKVSDEEISFITDCDVSSLMRGNVEKILYTLGKKGSMLYRINEEPIFVPSEDVDVIDTTGAGDTFLGSYLSVLDEDTSENRKLMFANYCAGRICEVKGAFNAMSVLRKVDKKAILW